METVICHLTDSIEMDKGCCDNKHMEDLMALELQEKKTLKVSEVYYRNKKNTDGQLEFIKNISKPHEK